ncbi:MAG: hypothetical protein K2Y37_20375 [Pirellulales bacterium]|nr:hypothetical protein [Pirellulales bacterium]
MTLDGGGRAASRVDDASEPSRIDRATEPSDQLEPASDPARQLEAQIAALTARQAEIEQQLLQLADRESRVAAAEQEVAESRARLAAEPHLSSALSHAANEPCCDEPAASAADNMPVELETTLVLRRLQAAGILRDESDVAAHAADTTETGTTAHAGEVRLATSALLPEVDEIANDATDDPAPRRDDVETVASDMTRSETSATTTASRVEEDDDLQESIDRYMERLLNRSRADSTKTAPAPKPQQPVQNQTHEPSIPRWTPPAEPTVQAPAESTAEPPRKPLKPARNPAPERSCDLAAMRELANASARAHLAQYARDERRSMLQTKVAVLVVSLVSAIFLLAISPRGSTPWCGGIVALLVAGFWGIQIAVITGKLTIDAQGGLLITQAREKGGRFVQRWRGSN